MHDKEFGLIYNRARYLHPRLGRFLQRDPLGYADGMSLYEYVGSNPHAGNDAEGTRITHYDGCSGKQKQLIKAAHDAALKELKKIKKFLDKFEWNEVIDEYVRKKERKKTPHQGYKKQRLAWDRYRSDMRDTVNKMLKKFNDGIGVTCEDQNCEECEGNEAYVDHIWGVHYGDINICPLFFTSDGKKGKPTTPFVQTKTFLHELSHLAVDTEDLEMNWTRESGLLTSGGWRARYAADDAWWFDDLLNAGGPRPLFTAHRNYIWSKLWPRLPRGRLPSERPPRKKKK